MSSEKNKKEIVLEASFLLKLFGIPSIIWEIISLVMMIPDETDTDPLTWGELVIFDIVALLVWFGISCAIAMIVSSIKTRKSKNKEISDVKCMTKQDDKIVTKPEKLVELKKEKEEETRKKTNDKCLNTCESKIKGVKKYHNPYFIRIGMIILFIITLCSLYGALFSLSLLDKINPQHGFSFIKNAWVFWCWLPIPILSIILGFIFNNAGFKCTKNIVGGFIIGFLLLIYGCFSLFPDFSQEYSMIDAYRDIIDAQLPSIGDLEIQNWGTYFDVDKTEYVVINAYYDKEDVSMLVNSIENSNNWILSKEIKSELKIFVPSQLRSDEDAYFSIYNNTTNQYNSLPEIPGDYEIYAMKYDKSDKILEIHKFKYNYK